MALIRFTLDLALPESAYAALPASTKTAIRDRIRQLKALAVKINAGGANEEMTIKAVWHRCYHDAVPQRPCEPEQDI